jgi:hypothetical protein
MSKQNIHGRQNLIISYLKRGFWIQETHDHRDMSIDRSLTNGGDDIISVHKRTIESLLRQGVIEEKGSWTPCVQIDIVKFKLKTTTV